MADMNPSPQKQDPESRHRFNDPNINAVQFMLEVMHDRSLDLATRIDAAAKLLEIYPDEWFTPKVRIVIPDQYHSLSTAPAPRATDGPLGNDSHFLPRSHIAPKHSGDAPGQSILRENTDTYIPDYSKPLSPSELREIHAKVQELCPSPDYDPDNPPELYLCACGHWLTFQCDCVLRSTSSSIRKH